MTKDYKKRTGKPATRGFTLIGNGLPFLSGLSVGLLVAFFIFIRYQFPETALTLAPDSDEASQAQVPEEAPQQELDFDFYNLLRDKKINISEWMAEDKHEEQDQNKRGEPEGEQAQEQAKDNVRAYILQVGSFREFASADQTKAELALLGISADIQRVMINGQEVYHRVRLGPFESVDEMKSVRRRLQDNRIDFILLELRPKENTT